MESPLRLVVGWVLAALVALGLSLVAVSMVRGSVIEASSDASTVASTITTAATADATAPSTQPDPQLSTTSVASAASVPSSDSTLTSTTLTTSAATSPSTTSPTDGGTSTTTSSVATTTTTSATSSSTTSTTLDDGNSTTTTSTTAPTTATQTASYELIGGTVVVTYGNGNVNLVSAVAEPGFTVIRDATGPERVRIFFESDSHESEFDATYKDGVYVAEVDEESGNDD